MQSVRAKFLRFPVVLLTFAIGLSAAQVGTWFSDTGQFAWLAAPPSSCADSDAVEPVRDITVAVDAAVLDYCELASDPDRYNGKTVRFRATLSSYIHGAFLMGPCRSRVDHAAVFFYPPSSAEIRRTLDRINGSPDRFTWREPVEIVGTGKFFKVTPSFETDLVVDTTPLQIELMTIETARRLE